jgi:peptidoglycan/LPS O-acetylase OafA/YrhL
VTGYRPWLDGVRGVAVLLVAFQHTMGQMPVDTGSLGVGLFFALSGYLITSLLLEERERNGSVSLRRFYLRRAARLIPALVVVVVVCDVLFLLAGDRVPLKGSLPALTYVANYVEILKPDFIHGYGPTWSLAVEEHFYILWPLALLWVTRRFGLRVALRATLAVCVASLAWRAGLSLLHARLDLLAIGSFERADALLYGCAAAIALRLGWRPRRWMVWLGVAVVAAVPVVFADENYVALVVGQAVVALAGAAVVAGLDYAAPPLLRRCLSLRPIVWVGVISYGLYLFHGPMMRIAADFGYSGRGWRTLMVLVSILAAGISYRAIEAPVRSMARRRSRAEAPPGESLAIPAAP